MCLNVPRLDLGLHMRLMLLLLLLLPLSFAAVLKRSVLKEQLLKRLHSMHACSAHTIRALRAELN